MFLGFLMTSAVCADLAYHVRDEEHRQKVKALHHQVHCLHASENETNEEDWRSPFVISFRFLDAVRDTT